MVKYIALMVQVTEQHFLMVLKFLCGTQNVHLSFVDI